MTTIPRHRFLGRRDRFYPAVIGAAESGNRGGDKSSQCGWMDQAAARAPEPPQPARGDDGFPRRRLEDHKQLPKRRAACAKKPMRRPESGRRIFVFVNGRGSGTAV